MKMKNIPKALYPPTPSSEGIYVFKVKYFDFQEEPPTDHQVWVDLNGNDIYDPNEKYEMVQEADANNSFYFDGEVYKFTIHLRYVASAKGRLKYRFVFASVKGDAKSRGSNIDLLKDQIYTSGS